MLRCRGVLDGDGAPIGVLILVSCQHGLLQEDHSRKCLGKSLRQSSFASALKYATSAIRLSKVVSRKLIKAQLSSYKYDVS